MDMKWHPIVNGDLSGIQQQETILFTLFDEMQNENYVAAGWILEDEGELVVRGVDPWGLNSNETNKVKAWMELPEPYKQNTDKCFKCKYVHLQHDEDDEDSDDWFECELLERDVPDNGKPEDCPLR